MEKKKKEHLYPGTSLIHSFSPRSQSTGQRLAVPEFPSKLQFAEGLHCPGTVLDGGDSCEQEKVSILWELTFFLDLQVKQKSDGIFISQEKYVQDILRKFDLENVRTATTP